MASIWKKVFAFEEEFLEFEKSIQEPEYAFD